MKRGFSMIISFVALGGIIFFVVQKYELFICNNETNVSNWQKVDVTPFSLEYPSDWKWKKNDLGWLLARGDITGDDITNGNLSFGDIGITFYGGPIAQIPKDNATTDVRINELFKSTITNIKEDSSNVVCKEMVIRKNRTLFCEYYDYNRIYKLYYLITTAQSAHSIRIYAKDLNMYDKEIIAQIIESFQPKY